MLSREPGQKQKYDLELQGREARGQPAEPRIYKRPRMKPPGALAGDGNVQ